MNRVPIYTIHPTLVEGDTKTGFFIECKLCGLETAHFGSREGAIDNALSNHAPAKGWWWKRLADASEEWVCPSCRAEIHNFSGLADRVNDLEDNQRDLALLIRRGLLQIVQAIEKRYGL